MNGTLKDRIMNCRKVLNQKYFKTEYNQSEKMKKIDCFVREQNKNMNGGFFELEFNLDVYSMKIKSWNESFHNGNIEDYKEKVVDISSVDYLEKLLLDYLYDLCFKQTKELIIDQMVEDRLRGYGVWK
jgi:hypothetical protein